MYAEFELIERIGGLFDQPDGVAVGIGDDCAVLAKGRYDLVTTDTMVQGVHFRLDWSSPADVGWKALAVSLSDVAAMGGAPGAFFLNLTLGPQADEAFVDALLDGMKQACDWANSQGFAVAPVGGDVTATDGPTVITTTVMGASSPHGALLRSGAQPGDRVVIFGPTGLAQAGVDLLAGALDADPKDFPALVDAHRRPQPLVRLGALLGGEELGGEDLGGEAIPSALVDTSDGLGQDLGHILERSGVGASLDTQRLPRHDQLSALCEQSGADPLTYQVQGGEDLQLCATVPPARIDALRALARREGWQFYDIGEVRPVDEGLSLCGPDGEPVALDTFGYEHFSKR